MKARLVNAGILATGVICLIGLTAAAEVRGAREYEVAVAPLQVTLYEGKDCLLPNGSMVSLVLTNDDADEKLQQCRSVTWKELRRE